jgi:hypothetical protein
MVADVELDLVRSPENPNRDMDQFLDDGPKPPSLGGGAVLQDALA